MPEDHPSPPHPDADPEALRVLHAVVHGRVQGVAFRWTTAEEARRLGLTGWVRNRPDGTVELQAEGPTRNLQSLVQWLQHGPPLARVVRVVARWDGPAGERRDGFDVVG